MKQVIALQSVSHAGSWHDRGTVFEVVDAPKDGALEVTPTLAADWVRWVWVEEKPAKSKATS